MKTNGKTIRQIADEIGVSKQAIFNKMKKEPLSTSLHQFTLTVDRTLYVSIDGENLIKQEFVDTERKAVDDNKPSSIDGDSHNVIKAAMDILQQQLAVKDKQIEELNERLAEAHKMADQAQQLHGVDKALELGEQQLITDGAVAGEDKPTFKDRLKYLFKGER